jgi:uncharacterized protein
MRRFEQYQDMIARIMPEAHLDGHTTDGKKVLARTFTFKVTDDCNLNCTYCFSGDTKITMADGSEKPIKDIKLNDEVLSFDEYPSIDTLQIKTSRVKQLYARLAKVIHIKFSNGSNIKVTPNHFILKNDCTWAEAGKLRPGNSVYSLDGNGKQTVTVSEISDGEQAEVYNIGTTKHTYTANGIFVHNCYQSHKNAEHRMTWEIAKETVDMLLTGNKGMKDYIDPSYSPAIIIEFIGGEPFLEIDLIDKICDYFIRKAIELQHPWAEWHMFSICSNGVLYFDDRVQRFLEKHKTRVSFSITIDGNKELHDSCRVFPDGKPSYDLAVAAAKDWMSRGYYMGSKITIAPGNVMHVTNAIKHMVELGYSEINANCVYEEGWKPAHATVLYQQMKDLSDYFLEQGFDFDREFFCSLYEENFFKPKDPEDNENWCGGIGQMLSVDYAGRFFPCIRYMEDSLAGQQEPYCIGNIYDGICVCQCDKDRLECLTCITRRSQSTDECFYCPIAEGCSWCSALHYQEYGTADKRVTHICIMHKARALANLYFWNKYYRKNGIDKRMKNYVPDEWALEIISEAELKMLKELCEED